MSRRVLAAAGAAALLAVALPALPALAAGETGTARLTAGSDVLPGTLQPFKLSVTNTSVSGSVNAVRLTFPPSATGITASLTQPLKEDKKFAATRSANGSSLFFTGGTIPAGGTVELPFNADVAQPAADKNGKFAVTLSMDGGATGFAAEESPTNGLRSIVRVLEVVSAPAPTAPAGVVDRTATGRQQIDYGFTVKNHGSAALLTTPTLAKANANSGDTIGSASQATLPANGGTASFTFPVTLAEADRGDRTSTFTAGATAEGAAAGSKAGSVTVQRPAGLALETISPNIVRPGFSQVFVAKVLKSGAPALNLTSGTLSFADTKTTLAAGSTGNYEPGKQLTFDSVKVEGDGSKTLLGDDRRYPVTLGLKVVDDNGYAYDTANTLTDGITLDAVVPVVSVAATLPLDADGARQTAVKNKDQESVTGTLERCSDKLDFVELRPNIGAAFTVPVTKGTAIANGSCSYSGSVAPASYDPSATSFKVVAQASDLAGNTGPAETLDFPIDNVAPALTSSQTIKSNQILASFTETGATKVLGGCTPSQYKVDGEPLVAQVLYSNGSPCERGKAGPDNDRILVLSTPKAEEFTSNLEYKPGTRPGSDPAKDGAGSDAATVVVAVVQGVVPAPPTLVKATRNGGTETAFAETTGGVTSYFTRIAGADDLVLQFAGGRAGYTALLTKPDGTTVTVDASKSPATVAVPVSGPDGSNGYRLQLLNQSSIPSDPVRFNVVLDTVNPALAAATPGLAVAGSASSVAVTFSEPIAAGSDFAFDWTVEQDSAANGTTSIAVTKVTATNRTTRTLDTQSPVSASTPVRALYEIALENSRRYEDRAGNQLANGRTS